MPSSARPTQHFPGRIHVQVETHVRPILAKARHGRRRTCAPRPRRTPRGSRRAPRPERGDLQHRFGFQHGAPRMRQQQPAPRRTPRGSRRAPRLERARSPAAPIRIPAWCAARMVRRACVSSSRPASLSTSTRAALEQRRAGQLFQLGDLPADGRHRHVQALGRAAQAAAWATSTKYLNAIPCMFPRWIERQGKPCLFAKLPINILIVESYPDPRIRRYIQAGARRAGHIGDNRVSSSFQR